MKNWPGLAHSAFLSYVISKQFPHCLETLTPTLIPYRISFSWCFVFTSSILWLSIRYSTIQINYNYHQPLFTRENSTYPGKDIHPVFAIRSTEWSWHNEMSPNGRQALAPLWKWMLTRRWKWRQSSNFRTWVHFRMRINCASIEHWFA